MRRPYTHDHPAQAHRSVAAAGRGSLAVWRDAPGRCWADNSC